MGFSKTIYTGANNYTSNNSVNFLGDSNLKISIIEFGRSSFLSNQNLTATYIIPITQGIGDTQTYQELLQFTQFCTVNNRKIDFLTVIIIL